MLLSLLYDFKITSLKKEQILVKQFNISEFLYNYNIRRPLYTPRKFFQVWALQVFSKCNILIKKLHSRGNSALLWRLRCEPRFRLQVHSRELFEDGRSTVRGTFVLEEDMGEPAQFNVFTHNTANPLIKSMTVTSPSQVRYTRRSDSMLTVKMLTLPVNLSEVCSTAYWFYNFLF